jgi:protein-disulfide isomerase
MNDTMTRRGFIAAGAAASVTLAGCLGGSSVDPDAIDDGDRPALGPESAPVTVTVFEDFACPHCRRFNAQVKPEIEQQYVEAGDVRYLHADFPIPVDETWSYAIGSAARAVFSEAGHDAFWGFVTAIYEHQTNYSFDAVETVAAEVAGVGETARSAAEGETYRDTLESDRSMGERWGVSGTPTVFVGEEQVELDSIGSAIEQRL